MESKQERVIIKGVEPQMIEVLVKYAYTSKVVITTANVQVMYYPYKLHSLCFNLHLCLKNVMSSFGLGPASSITFAECYGC